MNRAGMTHIAAALDGHAAVVEASEAHHADMADAAHRDLAASAVADEHTEGHTPGAPHDPRS